MARPIEGDFLEHHFDRSVGFAVYALLVVSAFFFAVPGVVGVALAYSHRRGASPLMESHYTFQIRTFWTGVVFFVLGIVALAGAAALGLADLLTVLPQAWMGSSQRVFINTASSGPIAWILLAVACLLVFASCVWPVIAAIYGFIKLAGSRPIGHDAYDDYA